MRGLELGLEQAGVAIQPVCYLEIEAFVIENLVQQMEQGLLAEAPIFSDLTKFPFEKFLGKIHGIVGGYPCQPFSHAGLRKGESDSRHLWPFIKNGIKKSRPIWVWFENVEGHISLGLRDVLADLRKLGYQTEVGLFSAAEVGAPHRRNRVFILGLENSFLLRMRGWSDAERESWRRKIQTPRSGELDNTSMSRCEVGDESQSGSALSFVGDGCELADTRCFGSEKRQKQSNWIEQCGSVAGPGSLANTNIDEHGEGRGDDAEMCGLPESQSRPEHGSAVSGGDGVENGMANSIRQGLAEREIKSAREEQQASERSGGTRWPARPGESQFEWEAPRLESSLGYAVNGYNYREDLLRMAGNAVVRQQSEKAFRTLLMKFL